MIKNLLGKRLGKNTPSNIMEDVPGCIIQETGQQQRPARMVGLNVLILPEPEWNRVGVAKFRDHDKRGKNG